MTEFEIEIVTPEASVYSGTVVSAVVPGTGGLFEVLGNHAPMISTIGKGDLRLGLKGNENKSFAVEGGVVEVLKNKMIVLVEKVTSDTEVEEEN